MNALYMLWMILISPSFVIFIAIPLAILGLLIWRTRRRRKLVPQSIPPADRTAVIAETIAVAGLSVSMMVMLAMYRQYDGTPYAFTEMAPEGAVADYWRLIGLWSLIVIVGVALALFRKTITSVALLTVFFCGAGYYVNEGFAFSYKAHQSEVRVTKLPLTITIKNDVVGANVWFNGVLIGKTPIVADLDDVMARIPDWNDQDDVPKEFRDHKSFLKTKHGSYRPLAWFYLSPAKKVAFDDEHDKERAIYARVELNGQRLFARGGNLVQSGSRIFGQLRPCSVELDMFLPRWLDNLESLINRARLSHYQVDSKWITAIESYGTEGWDRIQRLLEKEPEFESVLDQWARARYSLPESIDEKAAQRVFEQIQADSDESVLYHTASIAGRAVDLLIPHLDRYELIDAAERRIESFQFPPGMSLTHGFVNGRFQFGTYGQDNWKGPAKPSDLVLAHAIWRLDEMMDQQDDSEDNLIEKRITPALMRLGMNRTTAFDAAWSLGGSLFESYVLRHDCRAPVTDETDFNDKTLFIAVNRWKYTAAWFQSPAGKKFRKDNIDRLQDMAERIVRESHQFNVRYGSNEIDFLFLDPELGKSSLGYRFYRRFAQFAAADRHSGSEAPNVRWEYLQRLGEIADVDLFVAAYVPYCDHRCNKTPLAKLEPEFQFNVLTALINESEVLIGQVKEHSGPHQIRGANHEDFVSLRMQTDCRQSVDVMLKWIADHERPDQAIYQVKRLIDSDKLPFNHLKALVESADPRLQELVLGSVELRPSPERRKLLASLIKSDADSVRKKSEALQARLNRLSNQPFSPRFIPPPQQSETDSTSPAVSESL